MPLPYAALLPPGPEHQQVLDIAASSGAITFTSFSEARDFAKRWPGSVIYVWFPNLTKPEWHEMALDMAEESLFLTRPIAGLAQVPAFTEAPPEAIALARDLKAAAAPVQAGPASSSVPVPDAAPTPEKVAEPAASAGAGGSPGPYKPDAVMEAFFSSKAEVLRDVTPFRSSLVNTVTHDSRIGADKPQVNLIPSMNSGYPIAGTATWHQFHLLSSSWDAEKGKLLITAEEAHFDGSHVMEVSISLKDLVHLLHNITDEERSAIISRDH